MRPNSLKLLRKRHDRASHPLCISQPRRVVQLIIARCLNRLTSFLLGVESAAAAGHSPAAKSDVIAVEAMDDEALRSKHEWGKKEFAIPEFEAISKCAYFDYQRSQGFIRTNPPLRQGGR